MTRSPVTATADDPAAPPRNTVFIAWLAGGLLLIHLTWALTDLYHSTWVERTYRPVPTPPDYYTRRFLMELIPDLPLAAVANALAGLWVFRRRGCAAVAAAGAIAGLNLFAFLAHIRL